MKNALQTFSGKKVFITGHTGFKGSWLSYILIKLGADVTGFALPPEQKTNHFDLLGLKNKLHHIEGDIRNLDHIKSSLNDAKPEFVFHLAAQALVKKSYVNPIETFDINIMGSANLLESIKENNTVRSLVYITSDKCYENKDWIWGYRENDQLGGHDPYSASKAAAEIIFSAYFRSFLENKKNLGLATVRAGNVIGGGDWAQDRIVPDCIRAIQNNSSIFLRHPASTRPWQHVLEPLSGYLLLAAKLYEDPSKYSSSWNFGPFATEVRSVIDVAKTILSYFDSQSTDIVISNEIYHEANLLQLNCDKSHQYLGWRPKWDVNETIENTAIWYKKVIEGVNAENITSLQIKEYFKGLI